MINLKLFNSYQLDQVFIPAIEDMQYFISLAFSEPHLRNQSLNASLDAVCKCAELAVHRAVRLARTYESKIKSKEHDGLRTQAIVYLLDQIRSRVASFAKDDAALAGRIVPYPTDTSSWRTAAIWPYVDIEYDANVNVELMHQVAAANVDRQLLRLVYLSVLRDLCRNSDIHEDYEAVYNRLHEQLTWQRYTLLRASVLLGGNALVAAQKEVASDLKYYMFAQYFSMDGIIGSYPARWDSEFKSSVDKCLGK